jgi:hypothetical protein
MHLSLKAAASVVAVLILASCEESPIQPQVGSGEELTATIDGVPVEFTLVEGESTYDTASLFGLVSGSTDAMPVRTILLRFSQVDIDDTEFPVPLDGPAVNITLTVSSGGGDKSYQCPATMSDCRITLTASNGTIVDGTFEGTVVEVGADPADSIRITDGEFSARVTRN